MNKNIHDEIIEKEEKKLKLYIETIRKTDPEIANSLFQYMHASGCKIINLELNFRRIEDQLKEKQESLNKALNENIFNAISRSLGGQRTTKLTPDQSEDAYKWVIRKELGKRKLIPKESLITQQELASGNGITIEGIKKRISRIRKGDNIESYILGLSSDQSTLDLFIKDSQHLVKKSTC